ncbi:ribbon-helix-helix domain-containing protein [Palleronia caenipelagi]|uniref:Ribbon-helix-helix domain-containing protein n=1 Tax=Palleronia caenipelagi TaxID=2489174 RepID=A0A547PNK0_9RHOB|nr:ribbon-helix-helix domain-containing protein [Palleronia caenipelagi]
MKGPPQKHSLTLKGHRTSVSLEAEFWLAFRAIAARQGRPLNDLAAEIDAARMPGTGLASALRVFVLKDLQSRAGPPSADSSRDASEKNGTDPSNGVCSPVATARPE